MHYTEAHARRDGHGEDSAAFARWMNAVDAEVIRLTGLGVDDIVGDWEFAGNFEAGLNANTAAREIIADSDYPG